MHNRTQSFGGGQDLKYVYDCRKNLFTNKPVQMQRVRAHRDVSTHPEAFQSAQELKAPELTPFVRKFLKESDVRVDITPSQQPHIDISDIKKALMPDMAGTQADRSIRMFLELLTTQPNINKYSARYRIHAIYDHFLAANTTSSASARSSRRSASRTSATGS